MSRRAIFTVAALGAVLSVTTFARAVEKSGDDRKRYEFTSKEGNFKAIFPGKPTDRDEKLLGLKVKMYWIVTNSGAFLIGYCDIPKYKPESDQKLEERLDGARDGMLGNMGADLVKETKLKLEKKYPGREVIGELPGGFGMVRNRIYLIDGRIYQVMVIGTKGFVESDDATSFIASFWLTK